MPTVVECSKCGAQLNVPDDRAGHFVQCPNCVATFIVPDAEPVTPTTPAEPAPAPAEAAQPKKKRRRRTRDDSASEADMSSGTGKLAWAFIAVIMFVLVGSAVLAGWLIILQENSEKMLQAADDNAPLAEAKAHEP